MSVCVITVIGVNSVEPLCCVNRALCSTQQRTENSKCIEKYLRSMHIIWKIVRLLELGISYVLLLCFDQQTEEVNH
jgi:hypothetical protein